MRNFSKLCCFLLFLLPACRVGMAAVPADFQTANALYDKGDYVLARAAYEALVKSGSWSAHLFYNLGNAAYRTGDKGAAFLAYERALALDPAHPEAHANLQLLRAETGARLRALPWYGRALCRPAAREAAWIAAGAFWLLCFSLAPLLWHRRAAVAPALFCGIALCWSAAVLAWHASRGETGIVTAERAEAHLAPADNSPVAAVLPMGSHARLLQERGPWVCVQLADQSRGWISGEAVRPVRLARGE